MDPSLHELATEELAEAVPAQEEPMAEPVAAAAQKEEQMPAAAEVPTNDGGSSTIIDVGVWLAQVGFSRCEQPLREGLIETVEDLLFVGERKPFALARSSWLVDF